MFRQHEERAYYMHALYPYLFLYNGQPHIHLHTYMYLITDVVCTGDLPYGTEVHLGSGTLLRVPSGCTQTGHDVRKGLSLGHDSLTQFRLRSSILRRVKGRDRFIA